jgi:hypothetical protein
MAKRLPKAILVYQYDEADGEPVYAVALNLDDIPEEVDGKKVGSYMLDQQSTFRIHRELK